MKRRLAVVAVVSCALLSAADLVAAAPGAGGQPPDVKAMIARNKQCLRALSAEIGQVTFDRKDVEKYLAEWPSFDALELGKGRYEEGQGPECADVAAVVADPRYVAWTRERGLTPRGWLQKSLRITLTNAKRRAPAQLAEMKAQMEAQRREMAKHCQSMGPTACRDMERSFASADEAARETSAMFALFPEPTRAEAALLAEYGARLEAVSERPRRRGGPRGGAADLGPQADEETPAGGEEQQ